MKKWLWVVGLAVAQSVSAQTAEGVGVRTFRLYRADASQTMVTAFINVPYLLLEPSSADSNAQLKFLVTVQVTDSNGAKLYDASWPEQAPADLRTAGGEKLEILDLSVPPGKYRMGVTITDSVSGQKHTGSAEFEGWSKAPPASDLMLSPAMRLVAAGDTTTRLGEIRRGNTMVTAVYALKLTPLRSKAYYLLEVYGSGSDSAATMQVSVTDSAGKSLVTTREVPVSVAKGGSVLKGQLDLAGLPAGRYTLSVETTMGGKKEDRSDQFVMEDLASTLQREQARLVSYANSDEAFFAKMDDKQLDAAEAPLGMLAPPESLAVWKTDLSVEAKRRFLSRFWNARNPTPGSVRNEVRERFYALIDEADRRYKDGFSNSPAPGWKSDRGRIFVEYGPPNDILDRKTPIGKSPPYQVWRYSRGKDRFFIFLDRTGFGAYKLAASNDIKEQGGIPGYGELLGVEALQDISRWLGIDLFTTQSTGISAQ